MQISEKLLFKPPFLIRKYFVREIDRAQSTTYDWAFERTHEVLDCQNAFKIIFQYNGILKLFNLDDASRSLLAKCSISLYKRKI